MLKHVKFGPVVRVICVAGGTAIGAIVGMTKGSEAESYVNRFIDAVNNTVETTNKLKKN